LNLIAVLVAAKLPHSFSILKSLSAVNRKAFPFDGDLCPSLREHFHLPAFDHSIRISFCSPLHLAHICHLWQLPRCQITGCFPSYLGMCSLVFVTILHCPLSLPLLLIGTVTRLLSPTATVSA